MNAFTMAAELLAGVSLTAGQLAQLRAIDHKYWQSVHALLRSTGDGPAGAPSEEQIAALHAALERDVRALAPADFVAPVAKMRATG